MYELTDLREERDGAWFVQITAPGGQLIEYLHIKCARPIHEAIADKLDRLNSEYGSWRVQNALGILGTFSHKGTGLRESRYRKRGKQFFKRDCEKRDAEHRLKQEMGILK